jgi:hypothetical protein
MFKQFLRHLSVSSLVRPVWFPFGSAPYPAGTGSAAIRRTMLPKSRRVALCQQQPVVARVLDQPPPPVFTNRCCTLVSDHFSILFGSTKRRHRVPRL